MCVGGVCTQARYNDKKITQCVILIEPSVRVTSHGRRPLPLLLIESSISAQTALVSYLRTEVRPLSLWLSTEVVAFSPRPHPYLPCFAPLSRERLSLHCSPN